MTRVLTSSSRSYSSKYESSSSSASSSSFSPNNDSNVVGFRTLIKCQPGLENVLEQELSSLGIVRSASSQPHPQSQMLIRRCPGQIEVPHITMHDLHLCHLYLGSASQIWIRCGRPLTVRALGELQRKVRDSAHQWIHELLLPDDRAGEGGKLLNVKAQARKSRLIHTGAIQERVLEAVRAAQWDRMESHPGPKMSASKRSSNDDGQKNYLPIATLHVSVDRDVATLWLDTSAVAEFGPLHRRGYRLETAKAPLREDLSYSLLYSAGWKPWLLPKGKHGTDGSSGDNSVDSLARTGTLLDPFCGSGTIVLEAAAIALGLPPGRLRPAPFQRTALYDPHLWQTLVSCAAEHSRRCAVSDDPVRVFGSDRDQGAVAVARANALRAGVQDAVDFRACAVSSHPQLESPLPHHSTDSSPLLVVSNPPFGRRVSPESIVPPPGAKSNARRRRNVPHLLPLVQRLAVRAAAAAPPWRASSVVLLTNNANLVERAFPPPTWRCHKVLETSHGGIRVTAVHCSNNGTPLVEAEDGSVRVPGVATRRATTALSAGGSAAVPPST